MLVIRQNAAGVSESPQGAIYPADRCTWHETASADGYGYQIDSGIFYTATTGVSLGNDITLGVIGKSGRFVALTDRT